jgi:hypothetical protein
MSARIGQSVLPKMGISNDSSSATEREVIANRWLIALAMSGEWSIR